MKKFAEGFERRTSKDFGHFLDIAKGSAGEVRSMTYAAEDVGLFGAKDAQILRAKYELLGKRIAAFRRSITNTNK